MYSAVPGTTLVAVRNSIFWGNTSTSGVDGIFTDDALTIDVTYSDVEGGWTGTGNIDSAPIFVAVDDYHLSEDSPCIDTGNPDSAFNDGCFPPSKGGDRNDMGAYGGPGTCEGCDFDGDGHRDEACGGDDCNDTNAAAFPGAQEICDSVDNDCDGTPEDYEADEDGDGVMICEGDCEDGNPDRYPGNTEVCDGMDNDCDGEKGADEADVDGDGLMICEGDCDDGDAARYPGNTETCDGLDNDCDGSPEADEADVDGDGIMLCQGDCDDGNADRYPGNAEICDGLDNNCADGIDEEPSASASCDDGLYCNGGEACDFGVCQAGIPVTCDDGVGCTVDACNEATDTCDNVPDNGLCDDGLWCNGAESCNPGNDCQSGIPVECDDGIPCTADSCNEDDDECTFIDLCSSIEVNPICMEKVIPEQSVTVPVEISDGSGIDDLGFNLNYETSSLSYTGYSTANCLLGGWVGLDCSEASGVISCSGASWEPLANGSSDCLIEFHFEVLAGTIGSTSSLSVTNLQGDLALMSSVPCSTDIKECTEDFHCDDSVNCTVDSCNEATDGCANVVNDGNCDDGLWCNGAETCDAVNDCQAGTAPDCDDGVGCTDDSCNEATDSCDNVINDGNCDDGSWCNGAETCDAVNDCQAGAAPDCGDGVTCTDDSCDEVADVCVNAANDGNCDDGAWCNGPETCDAVSDCQTGTAPDCDDSVSCMVDSCNEATDSCDHVPTDSLCDDGVWCNGVEICDTLNDCQAGTQVECNDQNDCTDDACNETYDICEYLCNAENWLDPCCEDSTCLVDPLCEEPPCIDSDGDGYGDIGSPECTYPEEDCDDSNPDVNPGATEGPYGDDTCGDTLDNDCDGSTDALDTDCIRVVTRYFSVDGAKEIWNWTTTGKTRLGQDVTNGTLPSEMMDPAKISDYGPGGVLNFEYRNYRPDEYAGLNDWKDSTSRQLVAFNLLGEASGVGNAILWGEYMNVLAVHTPMLEPHYDDLPEETTPYWFGQTAGVNTFYTPTWWCEVQANAISKDLNGPFVEGSFSDIVGYDIDEGDIQPDGRVMLWIAGFVTSDLAGMVLGTGEYSILEGAVMLYAMSDEDGDGRFAGPKFEVPAGEWDCDDDDSNDPSACANCTCGETECAPCARCVFTGALELKGDGIDSNCNTQDDCFIATASFGTRMDGKIGVLRAFRDYYLMGNKTGRDLVERYYRYSPWIAKKISAHEGLRRVVRILLLPLVGATWILTPHNAPYIEVQEVAQISDASIQSTSESRQAEGWGGDRPTKQKPPPVLPTGSGSTWGASEFIAEPSL